MIAMHIRSEVKKLEPQRTQRTQRFTEKYLFYIPIGANWFDVDSKFPFEKTFFSVDLCVLCVLCGNSTWSKQAIL